MTKKGEDEAIAQVETQYMEDKVLVVFLPDCHDPWRGSLQAGCGSISISPPLCSQGAEIW